MINFIKQYQLPNLRLKLILLYLLNISDIILTLLLLETGIIMEANPIMSEVMESNLFTFIIKGVLPAILFIYLYVTLKTASIEMIRLTNYCLLSLLGFYLSINCLHLIWFIGFTFIFMKKSYAFTSHIFQFWDSFSKITQRITTKITTVFAVVFFVVVSMILKLY